MKQVGRGNVSNELRGDSQIVLVQVDHELITGLRTETSALREVLGGVIRPAGRACRLQQ